MLHMKAIVLEKFGGPEVLTLQNVPEPTCGPFDVIINVKATAVNRADLLERQGLYPPPGKKPRYQVPGLECAGVISKAGDQVTRFQPGDRVMALLSGGGYAEQVMVHEEMAWPIPSHLSFEQAAAIPEVFLTAYDALFNKAHLNMGQSVLIHAAAGGVGSAAVQLAHIAGIHIIATVGSPEKAVAVRKLGAQHVVNYREEAFAEVAKHWDFGPGVDAVIDFVGQDYLTDNVSVLRPGGCLVIVGTLSGTEASVNLGELLRRRLTIQGTALRSRTLGDKIHLVQDFVSRAMPWFKEGAMHPLVAKTFSLSDVGEAHRFMESNANIGKIVLRL